MQNDERGQAEQVVFKIIVAVAVFVVVVGIINWWDTRPQDKIAIIGDPSFGNPERSPGESTTLTVQIKNMSDVSTAENVLVSVTPSTSVIQVTSENQFVIGDLGPGEMRSPVFSILVAQDAINGTYNVTVNVSVDSPFQGDSKTSVITVTT